MNDNIFRKKSVNRMSSPEQLNDYIRVTNFGKQYACCGLGQLRRIRLRTLEN